MLGRDKLTVVMWVTAGVAAVAVVVFAGTVSRPDVAAIIVMVTALAAVDARGRCLNRRRMRRQWRVDTSVISSADYLRGQTAAQNERLDNLELQVSALWATLREGDRELSTAGMSDPRAPRRRRLSVVRGRAG